MGNTTGDAMSLDGTSHNSKDAVFTKIETVTVNAIISKAEVLINTFFSSSPIWFLRVTTWTLISGDEDIFFLRFLPSRTLTHLVIDFTRLDTRQLSPNSLRQARNLANLSFIRIMHPNHLIITDYAEFGELLDSWTNLRRLHLHLLFLEQPTLFAGGLPPNRFARRTQQGVDLSCISFFAKHLPKLGELILSIPACDTSPLIPIANTCTFKRLKKFKLEYSFLNWRLPNFNQHEAAQYLSAVIPSSTMLDIQTIKLRDASPTWRAYEEEYNTFIGSFLEQIKNYMRVRECEVTRMMALLKTGTGEFPSAYKVNRAFSQSAEVTSDV